MIVAAIACNLHARKFIRDIIEKTALAVSRVMRYVRQDVISIAQQPEERTQLLRCRADIREFPVHGLAYLLDFGAGDVLDSVSCRQ